MTVFEFVQCKWTLNLWIFSECKMNTMLLLFLTPLCWVMYKCSPSSLTSSSRRLVAREDNPAMIAAGMFNTLWYSQHKDIVRNFTLFGENSNKTFHTCIFSSVMPSILKGDGKIKSFLTKLLEMWCFLREIVIKSPFFTYTLVWTCKAKF